MSGRVERDRVQTVALENRSMHAMKLFLVGGATLMTTFALASLFAAQLGAVLTN